MNEKDDVRDDLSALIDGALDPDRKREVEAAIENDPALRAEYARLLKVDSLYASLPCESAPANFAEGVRDAIARREKIAGAEPPQTRVKLRMFTQAPRRSIFWPLAAAATVLVGFFFWTTVNPANRSNTLLSMQQSVPAKTAQPQDKDEPLYKVRVMPEEKAKAEAPGSPVASAPKAAPAAPAPDTAQELSAAPSTAAPATSTGTAEAQPEAMGQEVKGQVLTEQQPPAADNMPALEPLSKEDRERALRRMMTAKKTAPAPEEVPAEGTAPAPTPPPAADNAAAKPSPAAIPLPTAGAGPQNAAPAPAPEKDAEQRKVAGRIFLRADVGWVDQAYKGEVLTPLEMDSDEYKELLPTHPPLAQVVELGGTITLRIDGVWRDLKTGRPIAESK